MQQHTQDDNSLRARRTPLRRALFAKRHVLSAHRRAVDGDRAAHRLDARPRRSPLHPRCRRRLVGFRGVGRARRAKRSQRRSPGVVHLVRRPRLGLLDDALRARSRRDHRGHRAGSRDQCVRASFALAQLVGIERLFRVQPERPAHRLCIEHRADAPVAALWSVVSDVGEIARFMPSLRYSKIRDGKSVSPGAVRECESDAGHRWAERIEQLDREDRSLVVEFSRTNQDFHTPSRACAGMDAPR